MKFKFDESRPSCWFLTKLATYWPHYESRHCEWQGASAITVTSINSYYGLQKNSSLVTLKFILPMVCMSEIGYDA